MSDSMYSEIIKHEQRITTLEIHNQIQDPTIANGLQALQARLDATDAKISGYSTYENRQALIDSLSIEVQRLREMYAALYNVLGDPQRKNVDRALQEALKDL